MDILNFFFCFDNNYNIQAFTSISSLLNNINEKINIHVIHPNENIESLFPDLILKNNNINEINFYKFDNTNLQFPNVENSHVSEATYYRFYIEKYIPQRYKFLVYLDADILTINNPLNEIKKTILLMKENDVRISVKTEFYINSHTIDEVFSRLPLSSKYFNAGVMIINYDKWINENTLVDLLRTMNDLGENIKYWDQDILNVVFDGKYFEMNQYLNFSLSTDKYNLPPFEKLIEKILFLHFSGNLKPWSIKGVFNKFSNLYQDNFRKLNSGDFHLITNWRRGSFFDLVKGIFTLKIIYVKKPFKFIYYSIKLILTK